MTRYLILWQIDSGLVTPFEGELPTSFDQAWDEIREWDDQFLLHEVRVVETGEDITAKFHQEPKPSPEGRADIWIKERKAASKSMEAA